MTKPQKLDPGLANAPEMKWYLPEEHHSGVPLSAECCAQFRTQKECIDEIREAKRRETQWVAEDGDADRREGR